MSEQSLIQFCANHPQVETTLRCNRCEKPICSKCAVLTPTGYRCKECVRGQQKVFDTAETIDYPLAFVVAGALAFLGSWIIPRWLLLAIFGSPILGTVIAEAVRYVVHRRRSKKLSKVTLLAVMLGCLPGLLYQLGIAGLSLYTSGISGSYNLFPLLSYGIFAVLVTTTSYYRLTGIKLKV